MARKLLFFFCLVTVWPALADHIAAGSNDATPINVNNIKMAKEHVVIKGHQITRAGMQGEWRVNCEYVFTNISNKAIDVKMAFPFPRLIHDFKVTMQDKSLPVTRIKLSPQHKPKLHYKNAYIWNIHFAPHQTITLHHQYLTGVAINSVVQNRIYYVLKKGSLWQGGRIGHALLEVIPNTPTRLCSDTDSADYFKPKPAGIKVVGIGKDKKYIWNLLNFAPESDLELCLLTKPF